MMIYVFFLVPETVISADILYTEWYYTLNICQNYYTSI